MAANHSPRPEFHGLRVLALESRRAIEIEKLIRARGGEAFVAPSMREVPLQTNSLALRFADRFFAGDFDLLIFLTGVGAQILNQTIETRHPQGMFVEALREQVGSGHLSVAVRGPKPMKVMREWQVPVAATAREPNTWRELLEATGPLLEGLERAHVAVQEYGKTSEELIGGLRDYGAEITQVPVYQWQLPEDTAPLRSAVRGLVAGSYDILLLTTSVQLDHLMQVAEQEGVAGQVVDALRRVVLASIGPSTTEAIQALGLEPDLEPSHPKMGFLVAETAERARDILQSKQ